MSAVPHPQQIQSVHVESIDGDLCVYDTARQRVHALNHTAAFVWQRCDGRTSPVELAAALAAEVSIDDTEAVVRLTLRKLAAAHLLAAPLAPSARVSRRDLLGRGVVAAVVPVIYSIVAPAAIAAQSPLPGAPTLTSVAPNQGIRGTTVAVTLTGTNFVVGATTVTVSGAGVTVTNVVVSSGTSLTANFVLDPSAAPGGRAVTVMIAGGTSGPQTFTVGLLAPTLTSVAPNQGTQGTTVAVTLTGTNFVAGATTVTVNGGGVTVTNVVVGSSTSLTASFVLDPAAVGARNVTVTTAFGTSGPQTFTINPPPPTLTNISPNQGIRATTVAVTLTGTNFVVGATTVNVNIAGVAVNTVVVSSSTSLTANFVIDGTAVVGPLAVTVTTAGGTTAPVTFTINPGSMAFAFTGGAQTFTVPPGVTTLTVTALGAQGGPSSAGGRGGSVTATLTVLPGEILDVLVGGQGGAGFAGGIGGFNGGGTGGAGFSFFAAGGGGASDIRQGGSALSNRVVVAGGGGGTTFSGFGGAGGGTTGGAGTTNPNVTAAGGGTQSAGGSGGVYSLNSANNGQQGAFGIGGQGGPDVLGGAAGAGGGGGYFGGGGGAGSAAAQEAGTGGGGSSFPPGATHTQGTRVGNGAVTIDW